MRQYGSEHTKDGLRLTFQKLDIAVIFVDGDGVEALCRLYVLLRAAGGQRLQQAGLSGSIETQNQNLCSL